ncbi:Uncharacterised protein [Mycobacteroides abscessus subsp. abscessus]|nr:Uncharacterised protein [Mycobacteroides abscessus subsp. abscessus]
MFFGNAPLGAPFLEVQRGRFINRQELGHVEADAARTDNRNPLTHRLGLLDDFRVREHHRVIDTGDGRHPGLDAGCQNDIVELAGDEFLGVYLFVQKHGDAVLLEHGGVVADGLVELLFAGNSAGHIELAADLGVGLEQHHLVTALRRGDGGRQSCRTGAHHSDLLGVPGRQQLKRGLMTGPWVEQAACLLVHEGVIEAGLVARDAGVDLVGVVGRCLVHPVRVGQ